MKIVRQAIFIQNNLFFLTRFFYFGLITGPEQAYFLLLQQLRPFTAQGLTRDKQSATQTIKFALEVLELLPIKGLAEKLKRVNEMEHCLVSLI